MAVERVESVQMLELLHQGHFDLILGDEVRHEFFALADKPQKLLNEFIRTPRLHGLLIGIG